MPLPAEFKPSFDPSLTCKHGIGFDPNDQNLIKKYDQVTIYNESSESLHNIPMYARRTIGDDCRCVVLPDCHEFLLQNVGGGKLVCYLFILSCANSWGNSTPYNAKIMTRADNFSSIGLKTTLTMQLMNTAVSGWISNLEYLKSDWVCDRCCKKHNGEIGDTPRYLVCDGKSMGPASRRVDHISELDTAPGDQQVLCQGCFFEDRTFLAEKRERDHLK